MLSRDTMAFLMNMPGHFGGFHNSTVCDVDVLNDCSCGLDEGVKPTVQWFQQ